MNLKKQRILVAFDGSVASEEAFVAMKPLLRGENPEVEVLYVFEGAEGSHFPPPHLAETCDRLRASGVDAHLTIRQGKPAEEILRYANLRQPDLIVMETEGRSGLQRIAKKSVAEQVLRQAEVPVLLVRPGGARNSWSRILVALDGSSRAEEILEDVIPLAEQLDASVDLARVALPTITGTGVGDIPGVVFHDDPRPYLQQIQDRLLKAGIKARIAPLEGRAASAILEWAAKSDAFLIALTTHGRTGLERVLMGSIAEEIVRHASCPVLARRSARTDGIPLETSTTEERRNRP
jgi:nucleotide-binding universal stress UspA family protein